jgi:hypothetical protein
MPCSNDFAATHMPVTRRALIVAVVVSGQAVATYLAVEATVGMQQVEALRWDLVRLEVTHRCGPIRQQ